MISHPFKHPSKVFGSCPRVIEETLGSYKLFMHYISFLY
jgi:hypothetical protein